MYRRKVTLIKFACIFLAAVLTIGLFSWQGKKNFVLEQPKKTEWESPILPPAPNAEQLAAVTTMVSPLFVGQDASGKKWRVEAQEAHQTGQQEEQFVWLDGVNASLELSENREMTFIAETGEFDASAKQLQLEGRVKITGQGFVFETEEINSNMAEQYTWGDVPVKITHPQFTLTADAFEMKPNAEKINFKGGVKARFYLKKGE